VDEHLVGSLANVEPRLEPRDQADAEVDSPGSSGVQLAQRRVLSRNRQATLAGGPAEVSAAISAMTPVVHAMARQAPEEGNAPW
jgi:hypothetical protein